MNWKQNLVAAIALAEALTGSDDDNIDSWSENVSTKLVDDTKKRIIPLYNWMDIKWPNGDLIGGLEYDDLEEDMTLKFPTNIDNDLEILEEKYSIFWNPDLEQQDMIKS